MRSLFLPLRWGRLGGGENIMEYELKFKIKDKRDILSKLKKLGAEDLGRNRSEGQSRDPGAY